MVGPFLLGPELGRGGMGCVHLAWDTTLLRTVAVKLLVHPEPALLLRLEREARLQAKVEHPGVCPVYQVGSHQGCPYVAMEYIQGRSLDHWLGKLALKTAVRLMAEVASAVHAAHTKGLVHRDLKPSNILVRGDTPEGMVPLVLDFGLALDTGAKDLRLSWALVGTPIYMSPEQAQGLEAGPASDVFALGATLLALVAGPPPNNLVSGATFEQRVTVGQVPDPFWGSDLEHILRKALQEDPRQRYRSAFDLERDLRRFLADEPLEGGAPPTYRRLMPWIHQHRRAAGFLLAAFLGCLSMAGWGLKVEMQRRSTLVLADRLGREIGALEQRMRIEHMLPPHDLRVGEGRLRKTLERFERALPQLRTSDRKPAWLALGSGYLLLDDRTKASDYLEAAWQAGPRDARVARALGTLYTRLFAEGMANLQGGSPEVRRAELIRLEARWSKPAAELLAFSGDEGSQDSTFDRAVLAFLQRQWERCVELARLSLVEAPWRHEARVLEAQARMAQALSLGQTDLDTYRRLVASARRALGQAGELAQSDPAILGQHFRLIAGLSLRESESGSPRPELFRDMQALAATMNIIRPDDESIQRSWASAVIRQSLFLLIEGKDPTHLLSTTLDRLLGRETTAGATFITGAFLAWVKGEAAYRLGRDPMPDLQFGLSLTHSAHGIRSNAGVELLLTLGQTLHSQGKDPGPAYQRAFEDAQALEQDASHFYNHVLMGKARGLQAQWETSVQRDPSVALADAIRCGDRAAHLAPGVLYPRLLLAQVWTQEARRLRALGLGAERATRAAVAEAKRALSIRKDHYQAYLVLAEALLEQGLSGTSLDGSWIQDVETNVNQSLRLNPNDFRVSLVQAQIEFTLADIHPRNRQPRLASALRAAERCLRLKPDAQEARRLREQIKGAQAGFKVA